MNFGLSFHVPRSQRWHWILLPWNFEAELVLYSIVLSFGLMRSLFILYVHEHDRLDLGMLTVETAVIREQKCKCCVLIVNQARGNILESVARSLLTMNEHAIANVYLDLSFLLRIIFVKSILLQTSSNQRL